VELIFKAFHLARTYMAFGVDELWTLSADISLHRVSWPIGSGDRQKGTEAKKNTWTP